MIHWWDYWVTVGEPAKPSDLADQFVPILVEVDAEVLRASEKLVAQD